MLKNKEMLMYYYLIVNKRVFYSGLNLANKAANSGLFLSLK